MFVSLMSEDYKIFKGEMTSSVMQIIITSIKTLRVSAVRRRASDCTGTLTCYHMLINLLVNNRSRLKNMLIPGSFAILDFVM